MPRQVRSKMGWGEGSRSEIADKAGPSGIIRNLLRHKHRETVSTSCIGSERFEDFSTDIGFALVRQPEALLRRARMLQ
jgi:hypothetical protein